MCVPLIGYFFYAIYSFYLDSIVLQKGEIEVNGPWWCLSERKSSRTQDEN